MSVKCGYIIRCFLLLGLVTSCIRENIVAVDDSYAPLTMTITKGGMDDGNGPDGIVEVVRIGTYLPNSRYLSASYLDSRKYLISSQSPRYSATVSSVPLGQAYVCVLANEIGTAEIEASQNDLDALLRMDSSLEGLNDGTTDMIPMSNIQRTTISDSRNQIDAALVRSVAKVELYVSLSEGLIDNGCTAYIPAGSQISLCNAMLGTCMIDRSQRNDVQYGNVSFQMEEKVALASSRQLLFEAYMGDYKFGDIRDLRLMFPCRLVDAKGSVSEKQYSIDIGNPIQRDGQENDVVFRNCIYRVYADISRNGNITANILDWDTEEVIVSSLSALERNTGYYVIDWGTISLTEKLESYFDKVQRITSSNVSGHSGQYWDKEESNETIDGFVVW